MSDFAVIGAGAMGTTMSYLLSLNKNNVNIWARRKVVADEINFKNTNIQYMHNINLPSIIKSTTDLKKCLENSKAILLAIPSHAVYDLCKKIKKYDIKEKYWLSLVKGMDILGKRTISQLLKEEISVTDEKIAVLSGPNFASEISQKIPTISVIGSKSIETAKFFSDSLTTDFFISKVTNDLQGVEIGGILKNIAAISIGLIDGLNLGDNTRGLVFSRIMKECLDIGKNIFNANEETLLGPACLGDMITTSFSLKSRNHLIGLLAAKGITNISKQTFIAEGKSNSEVIKEIARLKNINTPVTNFVCNSLSGMNPYMAFNILWTQLKNE